MDFIKLAQSRHSIRKYTEQEVAREDIVTLLEAARSAPSAGNCQPWHFYVIRDKKLQAEIAEVSWRQTFIEAAPLVFVVCADSSKNAHRYAERGRDLYCIQDTAAAIENMLLCAKSMGLGGCWCGAFDEGELAKLLAMPGELRPIAVIPIGYPASEPRVGTSRRALEEIATFIGDGSGGK